MRGIGILALVVLGVYMAVDHTTSPLNHELIGLGNQHSSHTIIGVVLLLAAAALWWMGRRRARAV